MFGAGQAILESSRQLVPTLAKQQATVLLRGHKLCLCPHKSNTDNWEMTKDENAVMRTSAQASALQLPIGQHPFGACLQSYQDEQDMCITEALLRSSSTDMEHHTGPATQTVPCWEGALYVQVS